MSKASKSTAAVVPSLVGEASLYELTPARHSALVSAASALPEEVVLIFPGRIDQRVGWSGKIRLAALRDADDLVRTPFHDQAKITHDEIAWQRDRIELLRATESSFQAERGVQKAASIAFEHAATEAIAHKETLLRAFDLRFAGDADGQRRLSAIRAGEGDADLVQDVSDLLLLCKEEQGYLAACPRGEAEAASRLRVLSPELSERLAAKGMTAASIASRKVRDRAYTLMMLTEKRFRMAADYWYRGTDKVRDYASFVSPVRGGGSSGEDAPAEEGASVGGEARAGSPKGASGSGGNDA